MEQRRGLLLPLDHKLGTSPWTSTEPCQHKTTDTSSPLWKINQMEDQEIPCCSLINRVWSNSSQDLPQLDHGTSSSHTSTLDLPRTGAAAVPGPWEPISTSRDYSSPLVERAIVTMDVEQIGPEDPPHHPLDITTSRFFMRQPWGMATNSRTEQVYIADREQHAILVFGPDGEYQGQIGGQGEEPGLFYRPCGLAYDPTNDRIIVTDKDNHRIQVFCATTRQFLLTFGFRGGQPGQLSFPWSVAVSPDGSRIAVTDPKNRRIQLFTSDGTYLRHFRMPKSSTTHQEGRCRTWANPRGIVFDKTGNFLYGTDFNQHRIFRLDIATGVFNYLAELQLRRPSGIDVDQDGNILVCDTRNNLIRIYRPDGRPLGRLESIGGKPLDQPLDISVMPAGHIAVLDLNGRVRIF